MITTMMNFYQVPSQLFTTEVLKEKPQVDKKTEKNSGDKEPKKIDTKAKNQS
jgi:hypothetical protein